MTQQPYGRIRVNKQLALGAEAIFNETLDRLWAEHAKLPNPSPESLETLHQIRLVEKLLRITEGTIIEKGWDDEAAAPDGRIQLGRSADDQSRA